MYNTVGATGEFFPLASIVKRKLFYYLYMSKLIFKVNHCALITKMEKMCVFSRSPHLFFGNYFTGGRCRLAWRVLTLIDENYRGESHEILVKCFQNKDKFPTVFQNILFISQFMNFFITFRGKSKIETTGVSVK